VFGKMQPRVRPALHPSRKPDYLVPKMMNPDLDSKRTLRHRPAVTCIQTALAWALISCVLSCASQGQTRAEALASWAQSRGGWASNDFKAFGITQPDPAGTAFVDLESTGISDSDLSQLSEFGPVYGLSLSGTKVTDAGLAHFARLLSLQSLNLDRTQITDSGLAHLTQLSDLSKLSLYQTGISDAGLRHLKTLSKLQMLYLDHTAIDGSGLQYLGSSANSLQDLSLSFTQTNDAAVNALTHMTRLRRISLSGTKVTDAALIPIGKLTSLHSLELNATHITSKGLQDLVQLPNLEILSLDDTQLGEAAAPLLMKLTSLKLLSIVGAHVPGEAVERLRVALPQCEIRPR
jgi:Leucine-rich repeat (LRR) protein